MKTSTILSSLAVFGLAAAVPVERRDEVTPAATAVYNCYPGLDCKRDEVTPAATAVYNCYPGLDCKRDGNMEKRDDGVSPAATAVYFCYPGSESCKRDAIEATLGKRDDGVSPAATAVYNCYPGLDCKRDTTLGKRDAASPAENTAYMIYL